MSKASRIFRSALGRVLEAADSLVVRLCATTRITSGIYYVCTRGFAREHQAVLAGRVAYGSTVSATSSSLLRRNIHRLEKGLLMRPRRIPFALDYIGETVEAFALAARNNAEPGELSWARDVLREYLRVMPAHPVVDPLRGVVEDAAATAAFPAEDPPGKRVPHTRSELELPQVPYEEFLKLARYRRSVRWFLPEPVPRGMIERAIELAAYSPTACNRLPYEFRIFDRPELIRQVIGIPGGTAGFSHQVPAVAVVIGRQRNFFSERDRHLIYIDGSLAIMSFVYALEVQGLSSCCINWPDIERRERQMARFLGLAADERPIMLVAFGYPDPDGKVASSARKPLSALCRYNFEAQ